MMSYGRIFVHFVLYFGIVILFSCVESDGKLKDELQRMKSNKIILPLDDMICMKDRYCDSVNDTSYLRLVVFSDSIDCSLCAVKGMYGWYDLLDKIKVYKGNIVPLFIYKPQKVMFDEFCLAIKGFHTSYPIYIDTMNIFYRENPQIPSNPALHTFLLDEQNNVILVGDPMKNKKIEELFWQMVEEKLGRR